MSLIRVIADLRERIERNEQRLSAIELAGQVAEVLGADQVRMNETISRIQEDAVVADEAAPYLRRNNLRIRCLRCILLLCVVFVLCYHVIVNARHSILCLSDQIFPFFVLLFFRFFLFFCFVCIYCVENVIQLN